MTNRERMLAVLAGEHPDRLPWIPRPEIWFTGHQRMGTLPAKYRDCSIQQVRDDLGMGTWANLEIYRKELHDVEVRVTEQGRERVTEYITPVGTVSTRYRSSERLEQLGMIGQTVEKIIKAPADYKTVAYIVEHTEIIPLYDEFRAADREIGDNGLPMVFGAMDPLSNLMLDLVGYNDVYYHLNDYPDEVAMLSEVLEAEADRLLQVAIDSPARMVMTGTHFSPMMTPPKMFQQKMLPFYQKCADRLHAAGKLQVCHADADTSRLMELLLDAGFDVMDSFVTAPMVTMTLERARQICGTKAILWGGLPSTLLCEPASDEEFEAYMRDLFRIIAPGDAFILAVADNIMLESKLERLERVRDMVAEHGAYPVQGW